MDTKKNMSREQLLAYMRDNCTEAEAQQVRMWLRERLKDPGLDQLFSDLLDATDYPDFNVEAVATLFKQWKHDKKEDILGYRNYSYRSVLTGTLAPLHHTPWMQAMDDSLEAFLADSVIEEQPRRIA